MKCGVCQDTGLVRLDGRSVAKGAAPMGQIMREHKPCQFCQNGAKEAALWKQWRAEFAKPIIHRHGRRLERV